MECYVIDRVEVGVVLYRLVFAYIDLRNHGNLLAAEGWCATVANREEDFSDVHSCAMRVRVG